MKWSRTIVVSLLLVIIAGGLPQVFLSPPRLAATSSADQTLAVPSPDSTAYDPDVQTLLETTYLGHAANLPDPEEPALVLQKYLEQNAHGYLDQLSRQEQQLDSAIADWEALVQQYPQSRHAFVALAKHYSLKGTIAPNTTYKQKAADAYVRAAEIGLQHGRIHYTRELSEIFVELGDRQGLDSIFARFLARPRDEQRGRYYLALMDYADGLAMLNDERAWSYFEQAIDLHPENNEEAINRYVQHLLERGRGQKALTVLDNRTTPEMQAQSGELLRLRKRAMELAGLDTTAIAAKIAQHNQQLFGPLSGYGGDSAAARSLIAQASPQDSTTTSAFSLDNSVVEYMVDGGNFIPSTVFTLNSTVIQKLQLYSDNSLGSYTSFSQQGGIKLAALRFKDVLTPNPPLKNRGGLAIISTTNALSYYFYTGSSWGSMTALGALPVGDVGQDIAAVAYPNGQADIFVVGSDHCKVYRNHSSNGTTWAGWGSGAWTTCGDLFTIAALPNGTAWAAMRATGNGNQPVVRFFDGANWGPAWTTLPGITVNDLALTAYPTPGSGPKVRLWGVSAADDTTVYYNDWSGTTWLGWNKWAAGYNKVASFSTIGDNGAFLLLSGKTNAQLYTARFDGTAWGGVAIQLTVFASEVAGADFTDRPAQPPFVHTVTSDDCRASDVCLYDPYNPSVCYLTQTVNLAEILYNEARAENQGARAMVGWTVRDRARQGMSLSCGGYVGGNSDCLPPSRCPDSADCLQSRKDCCAEHGGTTAAGQPTSQFNDGHVPLTALSAGDYLEFAVNILQGRIPDPSTHFLPSGPTGCNPNSPPCDAVPVCSSGPQNIRGADPYGPMEYLGHDYCAKTNGAPLSSCKWYAGDYCGNTPPPPAQPIDVFPHGACAQTNPQASGDNFFWDRQP
jgi:hypothetical protein